MRLVPLWSWYFLFVLNVILFWLIPFELSYFGIIPWSPCLLSSVSLGPVLSSVYHDLGRLLWLETKSCWAWGSRDEPYADLQLDGTADSLLQQTNFLLGCVSWIFPCENLMGLRFPTAVGIHSCVQMPAFIGQFVCSGAVRATLCYTCWHFCYCHLPWSTFQIGFMFFLGKRYINAWFTGTHETCRYIGVTASPSYWIKWLEKGNQGGCHMPLHGS